MWCKSHQQCPIYGILDLILSVENAILAITKRKVVTMTTLNNNNYIHPVLHNFGYIQQYKRHLLDNMRLGKDTCSCKLYCADNAIHADKVGK